MERLFSLIGIFVLLGVCWFFSTARSRVSGRIVFMGIALQVYLAVFLVRPEFVPWTLTLASAFCLGVLVKPRLWLRGADPDDSSLRSFALVAAHALGQLGFATAVIVACSPHILLAVFVLGLLVISIRYLSAATQAKVVAATAIIGCIFPATLCWTGALPANFVFLALSEFSVGLMWVIGFAKLGAGFVFGDLATAGWVFAIQVGAIVVLFSALMSALYYIRILPWLVGVLARLLYRAMGVSGAEALSAASNVFIGQTEAPLVVRPYLSSMTRSELMALMAGGFATIAGSVFAIYVNQLSSSGFDRGAVDLLAASVMSAPAAFVFAKLLVPETEESVTSGGPDMPKDRMGVNLLDAIANGTTAGMRLAVNIAGMLLVFFALIKMLDATVTWTMRGLAAQLHPIVGDMWSSDVVFADLYKWIFSPFAWLMGVPSQDCVQVGELLGLKTLFNEYFAYERLAEMIQNNEIGRRSAVLATYALCGFANFMSIGIQIGGLSALAPDRRTDFAKLALKAMIAGALACQLTACIVGVIGEF